MSNRFKYVILLMLVLVLLPKYLFASEIAKSKVKGDPDVLWKSILDSSDIENTPYNRCLLINKLKPGQGLATNTSSSQYKVLTKYITTLYAQSIKISSYIEEEKTKETSTPDLSNKISLLENEVMLRLADISRRVNIINAFEAGTAVLRAVNNLSSSKSIIYRPKAIKDGEYQNVSDCEYLKD